MWIKVDGIIQKVISVKEFDFSRAVRPGDRIRFISEIAGEREIIDKERVFIAEGTVVSVKEKFCVVNTGRRLTTVNWWNIMEINSSGYTKMRAYLDMLRTIA